MPATATMAAVVQVLTDRLGAAEEAAAVALSEAQSAKRAVENTLTLGGACLVGLFSLFGVYSVQRVEVVLKIML